MDQLNNCPICGSVVVIYADRGGFYCRNVWCHFEDDVVDDFLRQIGPLRALEMMGL